MTKLEGRLQLCLQDGRVEPIAREEIQIIRFSVSVAERQGSASGKIELSCQRELAEGFEYGSGCFRKRLLKHKQLNYIAEFSKALLAEQKKE